MTLGKYAAIARTSFRQRWSELGVLLGRAAFFCLLLLIFSRLWQAVFAAERARGELPAASFEAYVWYLVVTEWVVLSQPPLHLDVEADVRSGAIAYHLGRPLSYAGSKLAEGAGDLLARALSLAVVGLFAGRVFSGTWPSPAALGLAALVALVASALMLLCLLSIGLSAFWLHDCMPAYLVWQKLVFLLGGLMLPLSIYPEWLQKVALATPFASMLHGPGQLVMTGSVPSASRALLELLAWLIVAALAALWLEQLGRRRLEIQGG